jgi:hypothetical protein
LAIIESRLLANFSHIKQRKISELTEWFFIALHFENGKIRQQVIPATPFEFGEKIVAPEKIRCYFQAVTENRPKAVPKKLT